MCTHRNIVIEIEGIKNTVSCRLALYICMSMPVFKSQAQHAGIFNKSENNYVKLFFFFGVVTRLAVTIYLTNILSVLRGFFDIFVGTFFHFSYTCRKLISDIRYIIHMNLRQCLLRNELIHFLQTLYRMSSLNSKDIISAYNSSNYIVRWNFIYRRITLNY